ncbi:MAG TPA: hypothetical protein ENI05_01465 [Porticoccus sp.]|nr:hypothetical protein [Porticoccus sp.]
MAMKHVRSGEVDTSEEVALALNRIIDNVNLTEAKVEQLTLGKKAAKVARAAEEKKGAVMFKTIVGLILVIVLLFGSISVADITVTDIREQTVRPERDLAILLRKKFAQHNTDIANSGFNIGTGKIFYVDSNVTTAGTGNSVRGAVVTLDEAINLCTANRGDIIYVMQGHAETIAAADGWDADVDGITIVHLGNGSDMGTYTYSATGSTVAIGATNVVVIGGRFLAGISIVTVGIDIEDGSDDCSLIGLEFPEPTTSSFEFLRAIINTTSDRLTVSGCTAYSADSDGATNFLDLDGGVINGLTFTHNLVIGDYDEGIVHSDDVDLEQELHWNVLTNLDAGEHCIEYTANATGHATYNTVQTDVVGTSMDLGTLSAHSNTWSSPTADQEGVTIFRPVTGINQLNASTITAINSGLTGVGFRASCEANVGGADEFTSIGLSGFGNDYFNTGWSVIVLLDSSGVGTAPEGEIRDIEDYISSTGVFTVDDDFSAAITTNDEVYVRRNEDLNFHDPTLTGTSGNIWYCDDGGSNGDGTTWQTAKTTLKAAEALMSAGDICYIGINHNENILNADAVTLNVAGTIFIGLGEGTARPLFDMDDDGTMLTIDAAVTLKNVQIRPGITACNIGVFFEDDSDGSVLEDCAFVDGEAAGTDEFTDAIIVDTVATDITIRNTTFFNTDAPGTFVNLDEATIANATITGCTMFGACTEAPIWGAAAVPTNLNIHNNTINNTSSGNLSIEFTGNATGSCTNNFLSGDTSGAILDPGLMRVSGNTQTIGVNAAAIDVPLKVGQSYGISVAKLDGDLDIFDVVGGPILITSFTGLVTETVAGAAEVTTIVFDGVDDFEFSTGVDVTGWVRGSRIVFSIANPAVLTQLALTTSGSGQTMVPWFCPIGMIEQTDDADNVQNGGWTWYMTFVPLAEGVTVVAQ